MDAGEAEMNNALTTTPKVQVFPQLLPTEDAYPHPTYYVRDCYPAYYELVLRLLQSRLGVTVTGTPGIGKSVFMAYFLERYSKEYPNATVVVQSYTRKSKLTKVVVARGGKIVERENFSQARMGEIVRAHTRHAPAKSMYLLDGPPDMIPPTDLPWVSFTGPNEIWFAMLRKNMEITYKIFMPTWTLEELRDAAAHLGHARLLQRASDAQMECLGLHRTVDAAARRDLIDYCFDAFGGVPQLCFSVDDVALEEAFRLIRCAVFTLSLDQISRVLFLSPEDADEHVHRLFHYVPEDYPFEFARVQVASVVIKRLLMLREGGIRMNKPELLKILMLG